MNLDQFVETYKGKSVTNNHGNYKGECVSLAARYSQEVLGVPNSDAVLYCGGATGGARDLYESPTALMLKYYDRVPFGQLRKRGDLVVWGGNLGKYGDVAIALDSGTQLFGQLGTPVFLPAAIRNEARQPLGYLRLKGGDMPASSTPVDATTVKLEFNNGLLRDANDGEVKAYVDAGVTVEGLQRAVQSSAEHIEVLANQQLGVKVRQLLGNDTTPKNVEQRMKDKYGGSCQYEQVTVYRKVS